jgi:hypothetical protein
MGESDQLVALAMHELEEPTISADAWREFGI